VLKACAYRIKQIYMAEAAAAMGKAIAMDEAAVISLIVVIGGLESLSIVREPLQGFVT
jgi:hypothetical protein